MGRTSGPQLQPVRIEDIVQTDVVTVQRDTPTRTVVAQMAEKDVGSVVVLDDDSLAGIVTDRSVALALESTPNITDATAEDVMAEDIVTGSVDMSVFDVLQQLEDEEIRRLPIVGEDDSLEGIVTLDDILYLLGTELQHAVSVIEAQSPRI
jgi:CBS domain-containing protein